MNRFFILIIILFLQFQPLLAIVSHSRETVIDYKKYYALTRQYPNSKYYHFEFAMILASMGKIEAASSEFNRINELDDTYAIKIVKYLENQTKKIPSWKNYFRLGFCYYFLFDDNNGRLELAERRVKRAKDKGDKQRIREQEALIKEIAPLANFYYQRALSCFEQVAEKRPPNSINAMAYAYQAVIKSKIKAWPEAKALCEKALNISPESYAIRAAYAETLRQTGNLLAATGQLSTAYKMKESQQNYEKELLGDTYLE